MNHDNIDLQIPDLGPADRSPAVLKAGISDKQNYSEPHASHSVAQTGQGSGWFTTFILVLLTAACSGLGYLGFGMQQTIVQQQQVLTRAAERISELEKMLNVASDSAAQTGQTLEQRLLQVNQDASAKYTLYDSEIAKLWDLANKQNKTSIEALDGEIKSLSTRVSQSEKLVGTITKEQQERLTAMDQKVAQISQLSAQAVTIDKKLTELSKANSQLLKDQQVLGKDLTALKSTDGQTIKALKQSLTTLQTQIAVVEETLGDEQSSQQASLKKIINRINIVEQSQKNDGTTNIEDRVKINEQAIRAIDGTRRQMNSDILILTQKLNTLQLRVNKL